MLVSFVEQNENVTTSANHGPEDQVLVAEQSSSVANALSHQILTVDLSEMTKGCTDTVLPEAYASHGHMNSTTVARSLEVALLDERALLACIVRTIPAGGRIRISSTVSKFLL